MPAADATIVIGLIELAGALLIVGHRAGALVLLIGTGDPVRVRLLVIEGALWGLNLKTAASLLKTIEVRDWTQIAAFGAILSLPTVLKRVMTWEQNACACGSGHRLSSLAEQVPGLRAPLVAGVK